MKNPREVYRFRIFHFMLFASSNNSNNNNNTSYYKIAKSK